jgi:hypothetical protein
MNSTILRSFWSLIEEAQIDTILKLNDTELIGQLLKRLEDKQPLNSEESYMMRTYISSKTLLIRELAETRAI